MLVRFLVIVILAFAGFDLRTAPAQAQGFPSGSYQRSCTQVHWSGTTLVAECQRGDGRNSGTGLADAARCRGDIANVDGQLRCVAGGLPPAQGGYAPPQGYVPPPAPGNAPGYGPPGGSGWDEHRAHCEELWHHQHELRDRLQSMPWGDPERERVEYRLHEIHDEREHFGCGD